MKSASIDEESTDSAVHKQLCTFWLSGRLFGVDILDVKEVHPKVEFTPIYHAPKAVRGYVNIRGQIHLILDLRSVMGFETLDETSDENCLVIFKSRVAEPFGVLVDKIGDVVDIDHEQVVEHKEQKKNLSDADYNHALTSGVCQLKDVLLVVINSRAILKSIESGTEEK